MPIPPPRTTIDKDEALRLRMDGLSGAEIARRLGYTAPAVRRVLKQLGEPLRPQRRASDERWGERLYGLWCSLRQRCSSPTHALYPKYGARGISICAEWGSFWVFYDWAIASGYRPGFNLEIVGRSRRFSPESCRWISARERMERDGHPGGRQTQWRISAFGETRSASEWERDSRCQVSADALRSRLRRGVPPEQAITLPPRSSLPRDGRRVREPKGPRKLLDWKKIVRLHTQAGLAPAEIAERIGASESAIRRGLKARGEWRKPEKLGPYTRRLRKIWEGIGRRCEDESDPSYRYYGERGARLCTAWRDFRVFHRWSIENGYEPGLCLTRKGRTRLYSPRNCRWATRAETGLRARHSDSSMPARWTVEAFGERKGPTAWSRDARCQVSLTGLLHRLRTGWDPEEAITTPPKSIGKGDVVLRPIKAFGFTKGLTDWSRDPRCKVTLSTLSERIDRGVPAETAIKTPPFRLGTSSSGRGPRPK